MREDPKRRKDGLCACGCGKRLAVMTPNHKRYGSDLTILMEPFATRVCAEAWRDVDPRFKIQ